MTETGIQNSAEHKRIEKLELASNEIDISEMFAWEVDLDSNRLKWGSNAAQVIGCSTEQLATDPRQAAFFVVPEDQSKLVDVYQAALKAGDDFYSVEFRGTGGPDHAFWRVNGILLRDESGRVLKTIGATQNITKLKNAASALNLAAERLATAEEASGALIYDWDVVQDKIWRSAGLKRVLGWSVEEIGEDHQSWANLRHPEDAESTRSIDDFENEMVHDRYAVEYRVRHKNGNYVWVLDAGRVYRDRNGKIIRVAGATVDINARKNAESSQSRQSSLIELSFEPIFVWDPEKGIIQWNKGAELLYGFSKSEALGRSAQDLLQSNHPVPFEKLIEVLKGNGTWTGEFEQREKHGSRIMVESRMQAFDNDGEMLVLETNHDITQRHRADTYTARMAAVALASHDALFGITLDGYVQTWNPGATRLFGYSGEEMIGQHITILADATRHPEQQEFMRQAQCDQTVGPYEARRIRKDGSFVDVSVSLAPVKASDGTILSLSVAVHDITDRKEWEARQKLMTRELAHRIKNSFAVLQGILRSTLRTAQNPQDFANAFSGRLQSLAAAQDVLTANDWRGAELGALVRTQLSAYVEMDMGRVDITGPVLNLPADYAAPFGLVFNELATNALKYGALSVASGSIIIFWRTAGEMNVGTRIFLTWQERGGPQLQGAPGPRGFGSSLIERSLAGAKVETNYGPEGLTCTIELLIPYAKFGTEH